MIYLGSDHGGFDLKEKIKKWLTRWGHQWEDMGNQLYEKEDDYPYFAIKLAQKVAEEEKNLPDGRQEDRRISTPWKDCPKGILTCRSAAGMVIAANKVKGARCATAFDTRSSKYTRMHNNANIMALSGDWLEEYQAKKILKIWLETEFSGEERHVRRIKEIEEYEK